MRAARTGLHVQDARGGTERPVSAPFPWLRAAEKKLPLERLVSDHVDEFTAGLWSPYIELETAR